MGKRYTLEKRAVMSHAKAWRVWVLIEEDGKTLNWGKENRNKRRAGVVEWDHTRAMECWLEWKVAFGTYNA